MPNKSSKKKWCVGGYTPDFHTVVLQPQTSLWKIAEPLVFRLPRWKTPRTGPEDQNRQMLDFNLIALRNSGPRPCYSSSVYEYFG